MSSDKLLLQFLVVFAAVVLGLFVYDRMFRKPADVTPANLIQASESAEKAMVDRAGLRQEIVTAVSGLKVAIAEFYLSNGQWPGSLEDLGMVPLQAGQYLTAVELEPAGVIRLERSAAAGGGGALRLIPRVDGNSMLNWDCQGDWDDRGLLVPGCQ